MATLAERLTAAQTAYDALLTGRATVEFRDSNGATVRYAQANRAALAAYIVNLEAQIAGSTVGPMYLVL